MPSKSNLAAMWARHFPHYIEATLSLTQIWSNKASIPSWGWWWGPSLLHLFLLKGHPAYLTWAFPCTTCPGRASFFSCFPSSFASSYLPFPVSPHLSRLSPPLTLMATDQHSCTSTWCGGVKFRVPVTLGWRADPNHLDRRPSLKKLRKAGKWRESSRGPRLAVGMTRDRASGLCCHQVPQAICISSRALGGCPGRRTKGKSFLEPKKQFSSPPVWSWVFCPQC